MRDRVLVLSDDAVFARMLELELGMMGLCVDVRSVWGRELSDTDVILVDLDSVSLGGAIESKAQIIGFTKLFDVSQLDPDRQCSLILHRPFEMRLLREEIVMLLGDEAPLRKRVTNTVGTAPSLQLKEQELWYGEQSVSLRNREAQVMELLLAHRANPVSREQICRVIGESSANKADVYVCLLRQKLATLSEKQLIKTVRGKGYCVI